VRGVERLVEIAREIKIKDLHHVSTVSVGSGNVSGRKHVFFSEDSGDVGQKSDNYYIDTKFQAEKIVIDARKKGISTFIYRVGNLVFDSKSGVFQENIGENGFYNIIRALIGMGVIPDTGRDFEFSFIDQTGRAIAALVCSREQENGTFHVYNSNMLDAGQLGEHMSMLGYKMRLMNFADFLDHLFHNRENPLLKKHVESFILHSQIFENTGRTKFHLSSEKTNLILKRIGFKWGVVERGHIEKMLSYCAKTGFLEGNIKKNNAGACA
jgi:thioester reductase-like protein